jgi:quaternary ammonium compound-resistance protein SugE
MGWVFLVLAGLCEIGWAAGMKFTKGFSTRPWLTLATWGVSIVSFMLLALAIRSIPIGTGYAVWTGIGAVGAATLGILVFHEPATPARIFCIALVVAGIIGLRLAGSP